MIKLNTILSELLINEALPYSLAKKYTSIKKNKEIQRRLDYIFSKIKALPSATVSKNGNRVYIPFIESPESRRRTKVQGEVEEFLSGTEYTLKDYVDGIVTDKYGRDVKLNKVLTKLKNTALITKINNDQSRNAQKRQSRIMVFSKHPYDIAGMSTDRGWTSCMNLYDGGYKKYVKHDVKQGSFIVYLTSTYDQNLRHPTARILVKPFINISDKRDVVYSPEPKPYGTAPENFTETVETILSDVQGEKVGVFRIQKQLYCDTKDIIRKVSKEIQEIIDGKRKPKTKAEVTDVLRLLDIPRYTIHDDLTVDVHGSVSLRSIDMSVIPINFGTVEGSFNCSFKGLTSLDGAPQKVLGGFDCTGNDLKTLIGGPRDVKGEYRCSHNNLTDLQGAPEFVGDWFMATNNGLTSLKGSPKTILTGFNVSNNQLTNLQNGPEKFSGRYFCTDNRLTTLVGLRLEFLEYMDCSRNQLTDLKGAPSFISENFTCNGNKLVTLEGVPEEIRLHFSAAYNRIEDFNHLPKVVGGIFSVKDNLIPIPTEIRNKIEQTVKAKGFQF